MINIIKRIKNSINNNKFVFDTVIAISLFLISFLTLIISYIYMGRTVSHYIYTIVFILVFTNFIFYLDRNKERLGLKEKDIDVKVKRKINELDLESYYRPININNNIGRVKEYSYIDSFKYFKNRKKKIKYEVKN